MTAPAKAKKLVFYRTWLVVTATGILGFLLGIFGSTQLSHKVVPATTKVIHGHWLSFPRTENLKYGGTEGIIASARGDRLIAGVFTHSGRYSYTFPFDEFAYVTAGSVAVTVKGQAPFEASAGHFIYFPKGTTAEFVAGPGYANIAILADNRPIKW
ncbi:Domain of unknown function DUF861, cupin-3 [Sphingomonadaceae bacterium]